MSIGFNETEQSFNFGFSGTVAPVDSFDVLTGRPKYNSVTMSSATNIPEVKTANWDDAYTKRHTHSNKELLDTYTQTESNLADAVSKKHEHSNKSVIDGITSALISAWNTASAWITTNGANVLSHIANTVIHVTANDKITWDAKADTEDIPTKTSELTNDSGFLTEHQSLSAYRTSAAQDVIDNAQSTEIANKMTKSNPTGTGSFSLNRKADTTVGTNSVAEGLSTTASGYCSHAEGYNTVASNEFAKAEGRKTTASGNTAHAEGSGSTASGGASHAEGGTTTASGYVSHAEGQSTTASGGASHAEGQSTKASSLCQHVQGQFNVEDSFSTYADIVGWGSSDSARKNISALTTGGDLRLKGDLYTGCNDDSTGGTALSVALSGKAASVHTHTTSQITDFPETIITKITAQNGLASSTSSGQATIELSSENRTEIAKIANKADTSALTAHTEDSDIHVTTANKSTWNGKQDALSSAQLAAANSGITSSKVTTYDAYSAQIANIEDDLTYKSASSTDVGKFAKVKTVTDGKVSEWEFGEAGESELALIKTVTLTEDVSAVELKADTGSTDWAFNRCIVCIESFASTAAASGYITVYSPTYNVQLYLGNITNTGKVFTILDIEVVAGKISVRTNTPTNNYRANDKTNMQTFGGLNGTNISSILSILFNGTFKSGSVFTVYAK